MTIIQMLKKKKKDSLVMHGITQLHAKQIVLQDN